MKNIIIWTLAIVISIHWFVITWMILALMTGQQVMHTPYWDAILRFIFR